MLLKLLSALTLLLLACAAPLASTPTLSLGASPAPALQSRYWLYIIRCNGQGIMQFAPKEWKHWMLFISTQNSPLRQAPYFTQPGDIYYVDGKRPGKGRPIQTIHLLALPSDICPYDAQGIIPIGPVFPNYVGHPHVFMEPLTLGVSRYFQFSISGNNCQSWCLAVLTEMVKHAEQTGVRQSQLDEANRLPRLGFDGMQSYTGGFYNVC